MRYFLYIAYKGTHYHGWQSQPNAISVQSVITGALNTVLRSQFEIVGSGRTDAGVHARQQVAHFDYHENVDIKELKSKLNGVLPFDIAIKNIRPVVEEAHARFDALERSYEYYIHYHKSPFGSNESLLMPIKPDLDKMNEAAAYLLGEHDFQSFSKVKTEVNNFKCTITRAEWVASGDGAVFHITANRFLRGMVRALVGTLLDIGHAKQEPGDLLEILQARNRSSAGRAVSADGLYLCKINYPESIFSTAI